MSYGLFTGWMVDGRGCGSGDCLNKVERQICKGNTTNTHLLLTKDESSKNSCAAEKKQ